MTAVFPLFPFVFDVFHVLMTDYYAPDADELIYSVIGAAMRRFLKNLTDELHHHHQDFFHGGYTDYND